MNVERNPPQKLKANLHACFIEKGDVVTEKKLLWLCSYFTNY